MPQRFSFTQNYPNPFNPSTTIAYDLSRATRVSLKIFDTAGREVVTLVEETQPAVAYTVRFEARGLVTGLYIYRLQTDSYTETKKMLLAK